MEYQPLLLRGFYCTRNIVSNPLESFSTREPQTPLCQICHKQSSPTKTRRTMNGDVLSCLDVSNRVLDCLFQVLWGWNTKIRDRQIQHLESLLAVKFPQMASCLVQTFFITRQNDNDRNLFLTKSLIDLTMQIIESKWHGTPKDPTRQTQGQFYHRHCLTPRRFSRMQCQIHCPSLQPSYRVPHDNVPVVQYLTKRYSSPIRVHRLL